MTEVTQQMIRSSGSPRFTQWVAFLVFSTITLATTVNMVTYSEEGSQRTAPQKWSLAISSITFILTAVTVIMHLHPLTNSYINGTKVEGGICLALVIFWAVTVGIITDPKYQLAVKSTGEVANGNLYYFSWAGFVCSVTLAVSFLQTAFQLDVAGEIRTRAARLSYWAALLSTSLVVMGSSINTHVNMCIDSDLTDQPYCKRCSFGIALGTISVLVCLFVVASKIAFSTAPFVVEAGLGTVLTIMYVFGVSYITAQQGPGAPLGNLYYFTWLSFLASMMIMASCFEDYQASKAASASNSAQGGGADDDGIAVEDLDDEQL